MREGWVYKKLGEICEIERGGSPRPIQQYITDDEDGLNWIKIGDAVEGSKYINSTKEKIRKEGLKKTRLVHKGDFILSNSMSFGKPYILGIDGCIHDGWLVIRDTHNHFDKSFLYYLLGSPNMYNEFKRLAVGGVVNNLNSQLVRNVFIPVPPLSEQQRIVSELDLLSSIIEKKKAQLKEYDQLAQSIFYDMFGDPVTNEKGWEVKKLGDICYHITDGDHMPPPKSDKGIPFLTIANIDKDKKILNFSNTFFVPQEYYDNLKEERKAIINDMLYTVTGSYGIPVIIRTTRPFCFQRHIALIRPNQEKVLTAYLFYWALCPSVKEEADNVATGIAQKTVGLNSLRQFDVPLPPLPLQQSFASKIEAIECQKSLIQQSITEAETLFNSRMDYWFS